MNFISTFDELNKLYEEAAQTEKCYVFIDLSGSWHGQKDELTRKASKAVAKHYPNCEVEVKYFDDSGYGEPFTAAKAGKNIIVVTDEDYKTNCPKLADFKNVTIINALDEALTEAAEEEVEDEVPTEEPAVDEEPRQVIIECDKCGALIIKDEADIVVDEETDLVNVEDKCQFCEETKGYKVIGVVAPYEVAVEEEPVEEPVEEPEEEPVEESLNNSELLKEIEKTNELKTEHESEYLTLNEEAEDIIDEDLADLYRKTFDKPASTKTQQKWEDELNGEMGEISDKRRKHLEKKFAQQRDWEARHEADAE